MLPDIKKQVKRAYQHMADGTTVQPVDGTVEIILPFKDRHKDRIALYVKRDTHGYKFSDDGLSFSDYDCNTWGPDRDDYISLLSQVRAHKDLRLSDDNELVLRVPRNEFDEAIRAMVATILAMGCLPLVSPSRWP